MLPDRQLFICDTHVNIDPSAEQIAEITSLAAEAVRRFGITPSVALLSHSSFGGSEAPGAAKMRRALEMVRTNDPTLAVEGEMRGDAALSREILDREFPDSGLSEEANLLIMQHRRRQYLVQPAAHGGARHHVGGILLGQPGNAHPDPRRSAPHHQHDGAGGGSRHHPPGRA
jgi:malate dehydrogenase (oxaloacetate-decarboxylating)(NADP+)